MNEKQKSGNKIEYFFKKNNPADISRVILLDIKYRDIHN